MSDIDRLAQLRKKENVDTPKFTGTQVPYEAFRTGKDIQRFLELRPKFPDPAECVPNATLAHVRTEWRMGLSITLIYGHNAMVISIKGKNLQPIAEAIKESKIVWLAEFDEKYHLPPANDQEPFIKSIEIVDERPESAPPVNRRH